LAEAVVRPTAVPPLLAASLLFGLGYPLLWNAGLADGVVIAIKGAGVGFLALLAATQARSTDGWLMAVVMTFGALGDVLLEIEFEAGVAAFALGHIAAIALYRRNRRAASTTSQRTLAAALPLFGIAMPLVVLGSGNPQLPGLVIYSLLLTLMAASAWLSRFPRYRTGLGAVLFVVSDTLIAARMGPLADALWVGYVIWLLYYVGQLLIFLGFSATLRGSHG
jgi:uncharacterized membrane protein YhhN